MATFTTLQKLMAGLAGVGVTGLFAYLFLLNGVSYSNSGDSICNKLECEAFVTVNTSTKICFEHSNNTKIIYKKLGSTTVWANLNKVNNIVDSKPNVPVDWYVKKAKTGLLSKNWTPIYDGYCWTGKKNENKLVFKPSEPMKIKWSFVVSSVNIDPELTSWDYVYKQIPYEETTYKTIKVNITEPIYETVCKEETDKTNGTKWQNCTTTIKGYKTTEVDQQIVDKVVTKYKNGELIKGTVNVAGTVYSNANVVGDKLVKYAVNWGDRNLQEFGMCREYEKYKYQPDGTPICQEVSLI